MIPFGDAELLALAHPGKNRILATDGLGHSRILAADIVLDAVLDFLDTLAPAREGVGVAS